MTATGCTSADHHQDSQHCITCGDDGDPMTIVTIDSERELATCVRDDGARETIETALVAPVALGDRLLVHAGTAIAHISVEPGVA